MSNSKNNGPLGLIVIILYLGSLVFTGMVSWNWIQPDGFGKAILFIIVWSVLLSISHLVIAFLSGIFQD